MEGHWIWKTTLLFLVIPAVLVLTACEPSMARGRATQVWFDVPLDRAEVDVSQLRDGLVMVQSHAASRSGIARVDLSVNGQPYRSDNNPTPNEPIIYVTQPWRPAGPGTYVLMVQAMSNDGQASQPAQVTVRVIGAQGPTVTLTPTPCPIGYVLDQGRCAPITATPTETSTPTPTPCPAGYAPAQGQCVPIVVTDTPTPTPTDTPTPTPTSTPCPAGTVLERDKCVPFTPTFTPTPTSTPRPPTATFTPTPTPPADIRFWITNDNIPAGSCTKVLWHVSNVKAYWVDGKPGAGDDGGFDTCPCQDETHTLRAIKSDGSEQNFSVTIHVSGQCAPARDTTPPPAPSLLKPIGELPCTTGATLRWNAVSDPSGIAAYVVQMDVSKNNYDWSLAGEWKTPGTSQDVAVNCYLYYRWRVLAVDGAGNTGNWSGYLNFHVQGPIIK